MHVQLQSMSKALGRILLGTILLSTISFLLNIVTMDIADAQYFGGDNAALTQQQIDKCERLIGAQQNPATGSGRPMLSTESQSSSSGAIVSGSPTITTQSPAATSTSGPALPPFDWSTGGMIIVAVAAIIGVVIAAVKIKRPTTPT
jgi:hypothetical protein